MDWLDLLVAQGTLKSLLQHHSSKASSNIGHLSRNFPSISKQHRWLPLLCYSKVILQRSHSEMDFPNMVPFRTSLVPQWLRICLPVDMGLILGLGRSHMLWSSWAQEPRQLSPCSQSACCATREATAEQKAQVTARGSPPLSQLEKAYTQQLRTHALQQRRSTAIRK